MRNFEDEQGHQSNDEGPNARTELCAGQKGKSALLAKPLAPFLGLPPFCQVDTQMPAGMSVKSGQQWWAAVSCKPELL